MEDSSLLSISKSVAQTSSVTGTPTTVICLTSTVITLVSCSLSILGSLTIILTYVAFEDIRTPSRLLLVFLSTSDLVVAAGFFYGVKRNFTGPSKECTIQSGITSFAQISSFFWTVSVTIYLYITVVWADLRLAGRLYKYFHIFSWGVPAITVICALCLDGLGYDRSDVSVGWCWVNLDGSNPILWMLLTGKLWEFLAYIIIPVLCILMKIHIYKQSKCREGFHIEADTRDALSKVDRKLTFIPVVFLLLRIWGTIRFIMYLCDNLAYKHPALATLHGVGNTFQGGANCILYCLLTTKIRKKLKDLFLQVICCKPCAASCTGCCQCCKDSVCPCCHCNCCRKEVSDMKSLHFYENSQESTRLLES